MKKVLIITSSLRHRSNSDALAEAFARGASEAGNEVETIKSNIQFKDGEISRLEKEIASVKKQLAKALGERIINRI